MAEPRPESVPPPHVNYEAEIATLGSVMLGPEYLNQVRQIVTPEDFYSPAARTCFAAILHLADRCTPLDTVTLHDELHRGGLLDRVGGPEYLARLIDVVPSPANAVHYAKAVHEQATARAGAALADRLKVELAGLNGSTAWSTIADIARQLGTLSEPNTAGAADVLDLLHEQPLPPLSLVDASGLLDVGELNMISGAPGSGKSLIGVNIACAVAAGTPFFHLREQPREPEPVLVVLAEYNRYRAFQRLANPVTTAGVKPGFLRRLTQEDLNPRLDLADSGQSAARLTGLVRQHGIRLVLVDSLSEISSADENDRAGVMRVVWSLREVANAGCAVLCIHHNRKAMNGGKGSGDPELSDVRGSGALTAAFASVLSCVKDTSQERGSFRAFWRKHNYAQPEVGAFRFVVEEPRSGVISKVEPFEAERRGPAKTDEEVIEAVRAEGPDAKIGAITKRLKVSEKTARTYLAGMVARMVIPPPAKGPNGVQLWNVQQ